MNRAKRLDGSLDNLVSIDNGIVVGNGLSTSFLDLYRNTVRSVPKQPKMVGGCWQGIHLRRQRQRP